MYVGLCTFYCKWAKWLQEIATLDYFSSLLTASKLENVNSEFLGPGWDECLECQIFLVVLRSHRDSIYRLPCTAGGV